MGVVAVLCLVAVAAAVMALVLISHCEFGEAPDLEFTQTFEMPSAEDTLTIAPSTGSPPFPISSVVVRFDDAVTGITVDWEVWVDLDDDDGEDDEHDEHDGGHNDHANRDSQTKSRFFFFFLKAWCVLVHVTPQTVTLRDSSPFKHTQPPSLRPDL